MWQVAHYIDKFSVLIRMYPDLKLLLIYAILPVVL